MKTVNNGDLEKQRKEVILVAISHENSITTVIVEENQQRFGGIPVLWKSSAKFHASNNRSQVRLHGDISIPHYLKENLFRQHRNLTILSVSTNREIGNEVFEMKYPNYCVTLYCWAKGYVPVGEKEFPRTIGQFHTITDVREGYCCFATGNKIFPGGGIYSKSENKVGTFGGFV
ncbi:hypothetical protein FSP39_022828 [Pinctada imbricata]|uniref:Uncharacterized protein n=1 Tax=Pinctada imbricata TaxID=66713 RepID=A0AA88XGR4_PINIB|nr:hypothetical protein FSP39_022828 [Pinctada imbricata]